MLILPKLGSQSSTAGRIVGGAPTAVESVFNTVPYPGNSNTQIKVTTSIELLSSQEMGLVNFGNGVVLNDIAVDSNGNTYVVGSNNGHAYLAILNSLGVLKLSEIISSTQTGVLNGVVLDASNNVYVIGTINLSLVVLKYNNAGILQWQETISTGSTLVNGNGIALDSSGNVYVVGTVQTTPTTAILAAYNASGTLLWQTSNSFSGSSVHGVKIAVDTSNNVYIVGWSSSQTVNTSGVGYYGSTPYFATVGYIAKYNNSGVLSNASEFYQNATGYCTCTDIAIDGSGNIYVSGTYTDPTSTVPGWPILIKFNPSLTALWQYTQAAGIGSTASGFPHPKVTLDASGNVYMLETGIYNSYVFKCNSAGVWQWSENIFGLTGTVGNTSSLDMTFDTKNNLYICGMSGISNTALDLSPNSSGGYPYLTGAYLNFNPGLTSTSRGAGDVAMSPLNSGTGTTTVTVTAFGLTSATSSFTTAAGTYTPANQTTVTSFYQAPTTSANGGLVWIKCVDATSSHFLFDTVNSSNLANAGSSLSTDTMANLHQTGSDAISFLVNGFIAAQNLSDIGGNSSNNYVSWMFARKQRFFDIVSYVGNGTTQTVSHGLGLVPGFILLKSTSNSDDWVMYHIANGGQYATLLGQSGFASSSNVFGNNAAQVNPTSGAITVGNSSLVNATGVTYTAYVFAHDPAATGIIQCGSYTGNHSVPGPLINLGWEAQFVMIAPAASGGDLVIFDAERGLTSYGQGFASLANSNEKDTDYSAFTEVKIGIHANGFQVWAVTGSQSVGVTNDINTPGLSYNYVAIRRGTMTYPQAGSQVFNAISNNATGTAGAILGFGFSPDLIISTGNPSYGAAFYDKLRGVNSSYAPPLLIAEQVSDQAYYTTDAIQEIVNDGFLVGIDDTYGLVNETGIGYTYWGFKRSPGVFDEVGYLGSGGTQTLSHNLSSTPDLIIISSRLSGGDRVVWTSRFPQDYLVLNTQAILAVDTSYTHFGNGTNTVLPTNTTFTVGSALNSTAGNKSYVAYLFGSLPGISLVSTYVGNGGSQNINCQFPNNARFILIKNTTAAGDWLVWDVARGIAAEQTVGGSFNSPHTSLNTAAADVTTDDSISFFASGFGVIQNSTTNINVTANTYLFFAIA